MESSFYPGEIGSREKPLIVNQASDMLQFLEKHSLSTNPSNGHSHMLVEAKCKELREKNHVLRFDTCKNEGGQFQFWYFTGPNFDDEKELANVPDFMTTS